MLLNNAIEELNARYGKESEFCGLKKTFSVYTTDKDTVLCPLDDENAKTLWIMVSYALPLDEEYTICAGIEIDGASVDEEMMKSSLEAFDKEIADTESEAAASENAGEYLLALSKEVDEETAEISEEAQRKATKMAIISIIVSSITIVGMLALLITTLVRQFG